MQQVSRRRASGFTMVEVLVTLSIIGILSALAAPSVRQWLLDTRVKSASEFYLEGARLARQEAIKHNSLSRLVLSENATNGQYNWQVDICFPSGTVDCDDADPDWSTVGTGATDDPQLPAGFRSRFMNAARLSPSTVIAPDLLPAGANSVRFAANGWLDTRFENLRLLTLRDATNVAGAPPIFPPIAVAVTLAGVASTCRPDIPATEVADSRRCP